jgi:hypothetical protein
MPVMTVKAVIQHLLNRYPPEDVIHFSATNTVEAFSAIREFAARRVVDLDLDAIANDIEADPMRFMGLYEAYVLEREHEDSDAQVDRWEHQMLAFIEACEQGDNP